MAYDVFISHSSRDKPAADALCAALEAARIRCWIAPRDVIPGRPYSGEIMRGIKSCRVMVLVFSSHSNASPDVLREVQLATRERLHLINFRIEEARLSEDLDYFLSIPHWLDALTPPMAEHHARLVESVKALLVLQPAEKAGPVAGEEQATGPIEPIGPMEGVAPERAHAAGEKPVAPAATSNRRGIWLAVAVLLLLATAAATSSLWWPRGGQTQDGGARETAGNASAPPQNSPADAASDAEKRNPSPPPPAPAPAEAAPAKSTVAAPAHPGVPPVAPAPSASSPAELPTELPTEFLRAEAKKPWVNSLGMKFVRVPVAGGPTKDRPVLFSIYETRVQDYAAYEHERPEGDKDWEGATYSTEKQGPMHPAVNVSWEEARAFCTWLTKKEHDSGKLPQDLVYRLPTDLEWSCAVGLPADDKAPLRLVFQSYDINPINVKDITVQISVLGPPRKTSFVEVGQSIPGTPYVVEKFEKKEAPGADGTVIDQSVITIVNPKTGSRTKLPIAQPVEAKGASIEFPWGNAWPPPKGAGNYADATARAKLGMFSESTVVEGNYDDGVAFTAPVGSYTPNALGLYDLGGNAWEWCDDWLDEAHAYHPDRGGSWMVSARKDCRSDYRSMGTDTSRNIDQGFRVVIAAPVGK